MARTGFRIGEAMALQWQDVNPRDRKIRVERAFSAGELTTPKAGHGRDVDLSQQTADILQRLRVKRAAETLRRKWGDVPAWLFPSEAGEPMDDSNVRKVFARVVKAAGLPGHFTPHSLRHTFASLLLQQGESPEYVRAQMGHASIAITVDLYGRWLRKDNLAAIDRLDDAVAPNVVAAASQPVAAKGKRVLKLRGIAGAGGGSRTRDLLITNQLLCL
jgi:integrase